MPAGGAQPSAASLRVPSLAARSQAHTPTGITAAIIPDIPITPTATIRRTATAQPITAMPLRPGPTAAAGAGAMGTTIVCAERLPPARADRQPDPALRARRSAGLFFAPKLCRGRLRADQIPTN